MKKNFPVKPVDAAVILLFAALTVYSGVVIFAARSDGAMVVIHGPGNRMWVFPIDAEETVRVRGVLGGDTVVRISGGQAWAESSPCDNQVCVGMGRVNPDSWWRIVSCLPNNVWFSIEGEGVGGQIDGAAW
ncbi:MAG: NusG domain II-containing protein [Treponema sp.]|nr:NusG domain II-containing protein [Treponema sp.]